MTDKQKAEEYIINKYKLNKCYIVDTEETRVYMHNDVHSEYEEEYQIYLDGLTEGEKIGKEKQWIATEKAQKKTSSKIKELEKENERLKGIDALAINGLRFNSPFEMIMWIGHAQVEIKELKAQNEKLKCCGNCKHYVYDCGERYCKYDATREKDCENKNQWEPAE